MLGVLTRRRGGLIAVTTLALAACGGAGDESGGSSSPLEEFLGVPDTPTAGRLLEYEVQNEIAVCMRQEGWEYWPQVANEQVTAGLEELLADEEAFGARYGYGVVLLYERLEEPSARADGVLAVGSLLPTPMQEYLQSLSATELDAYDESLHGPPPDERAQQVEPHGCVAVAMKRALGDSPLADEVLIADVSGRFADAESRAPLSTAYDAWSACMADADPTLRFDRPEEVRAHLEGRKYELEGLRAEPADPETGAPLDELLAPAVATVSVSPTAAFVYVGVPYEISERDLEALRSEELYLFRLDRSCQDETDLPALRRSVEIDVVAGLTD